MNVLLVHPKLAMTYWGFQYSLGMIGARSSQVPLGLITVAAHLPDEWELRLVDLNVESLRDRHLRWADTVLVSGMLVQLSSMRDVCRRAREAGTRVVVGGPGPTTSPELYPDAHVVFRGELEGRAEVLLDAVDRASDEPVVVDPPRRRPEMSLVRPPRYDLLKVRRYASLALQYSRGCPHNCEFCDVVEVFGHRPRVKSSAQVQAELEGLFRMGYRGSVFFVDDNFIGNRRAAGELLRDVRKWQEDRGRPFSFYTEASIDLAERQELVQAMVEAGFAAVFVGIESPSPRVLRDAGKKQNLRLDLRESVRFLNRSGLEVMGGFIVGFDGDTDAVFDEQLEFMRSASIPIAMVGLLSALPSTALWRRLRREGRLRRAPTGDQFERPNFEPVMDEETLLRGYAGLLKRLYAPDAYYDRCGEIVRLRSARPPTQRRLLWDVAALLRAFVRIGVFGGRRRHFWRLLARSARGGRRAVTEAITLAVKGEHLILYTRRHVLPRIEAALEAVRREHRRQEPAELPTTASAS